MEPPRGQRLPQGRAPVKLGALACGRALANPLPTQSQGEHVPSWAHRTLWRSRHKLAQQMPQPAWERTDCPLTVSRWKRYALMHVVPVCVAMIWQLGVVIGVLGVCLLGLTLFRLLRP